MRKTRTKTPDLTGESFEVLPAEEKERIYQEFERLTPEQVEGEFRPLSAGERARHMRPQGMDRSRRGKVTKIITLRVEKSLLMQADRYAKEHGLKRTQLFARGLRLAIGENGT